MPGRVEVYIHSDSATENKGACIVEFRCATDFCAKTQEFKDFCKKAVKYIYAFGNWREAVLNMPELEVELNELSKSLGENIIVRQSHRLTIENMPEITYEM